MIIIITVATWLATEDGGVLVRSVQAKLQAAGGVGHGAGVGGVQPCSTRSSSGHHTRTGNSNQFNSIKKKTLLSVKT